MGIKNEKTVWLNPSHPNFERWLQGRECARERAEIAWDIISAYKPCKNLNVLDIGSGEGGTSFFFSQSNNVVSYDFSLFRLKLQRQRDQNFSIINGKAEYLPFLNSSFELILLQDVIEHVKEKVLLVKEVKRVLKKDGFIYISTPNKLSLFNILSDPHWGLPFLSLFKRPAIRKYFLRFFRREDSDREDLAELLSLKELSGLFKDFPGRLYTEEIVKLISKDFRGVLWNDFHVALYFFLKKCRLFYLVKKTANNKPGIVNKFFTPTFYAVHSKR